MLVVRRCTIEWKAQLQGEVASMRGLHRWEEALR
jgi:hypothetical protein